MGDEEEMKETVAQHNSIQEMDKENMGIESKVNGESGVEEDNNDNSENEMKEEKGTRDGVGKKSEETSANASTNDFKSTIEEKTEVKDERKVCGTKFSKKKEKEMILEIFGDMKRTKTTGYEAYFSILFSLLDNSIESIKYEETIRQTLGQHAYMLSTTDKVLSNLLRQLLAVMNDDVDQTNTTCLELFKERQKKEIAHLLTWEDTKKALTVIANAGEKTRSEEAFKISFLEGPKLVGNVKKNKVIRIQEDIVLFEYITIHRE